MINFFGTTRNRRFFSFIAIITAMFLVFSTFTIEAVAQKKKAGAVSRHIIDGIGQHLQPMVAGGLPGGDGRPKTAPLEISSPALGRPGIV